MTTDIQQRTYWTEKGEDYEYALKVILVGNDTVGKTTLFRQLFHKGIDIKCGLSIEFGVWPTEVEQTRVNGQVWYPLIGLGRFVPELPRIYCSRAVGVILMYDVTSRQSFESVAEYLSQVRDMVGGNAVVMLIGSKCDLEEQREVSVEEAKEFADEHNLLFIETSGKCNINVEKAFSDLNSEVYHKFIKNKRGFIISQNRQKAPEPQHSLLSYCSVL